MGRGRHLPQRLKGLLIGKDGKGVQVIIIGPLFHQLISKLRRSSCHYIAVGPCDLRQPGIDLFLPFPYVKHIQSDGCRVTVLAFVQTLQHHSHDVPPPLIIRADLFHGMLVNSDNDNSLIQCTGFLIQGIRRSQIPLVHQSECHRHSQDQS